MKALLVIDYTNDFVADDGALTCGKVAQDLEHNIISKILQYKGNDHRIYAINDIHYENDVWHPEHKLFPKHNMANTEGREIYGKVGKILKDLKSGVRYFDKIKYSAFSSTNLHYHLGLAEITEIELCGVCTDICILHTAVDAYNLAYKVTIDSKCVASFDVAGHQWALNHFEKVLGFTVI